MHYRARTYDPATGRFLQEDPLGFASQDGLNIYRYVRSNPLNYSDPFGLAAAPNHAQTTAVATGASSGLSALGYRLACTFGTLASVSSVLPGGKVQKFVVDKSICGARSLTIKQIKRIQKTACRVVERYGKEPQRKGARFEEIIIDILQELTFEIIDRQASFNPDTGKKFENMRVDTIVKKDSERLVIEIKGGPKSGLSKNQKNNLGSYKNLVLKFYCRK